MNESRDPLYRNKHAGVPGNGGQTAEHPRDASGISIARNSGYNSLKLDARAQNLAEAGYVEHDYLYDVGDPRSTAERGTWWDRSRVTAAYQTGASYPQMPDDNTPKQTAGRSLSSKRRTHRMSYEGVDGFNIRMPSHTAMHRFADELNTNGRSATFDVPVQAVGPNGHVVQGWVRATRLDRNTWSTSPMGLPPAAGASMAEAVSAVAEARRGQVRSSARHAGDLVARAARREMNSGITEKQVAGSWIGAVGYDSNSQVMSMTTAQGKTYSYDGISPSEHKEFLAARSPGSVFHAIIRGKNGNDAKSSAGPMSRCSKCRRVTNDLSSHMCPSGVHGAPSTTGVAANERAETRTKALFANESLRRHLEGRK